MPLRLFPAPDSSLTPDVTPPLQVIPLPPPVMSAVTIRWMIRRDLPEVLAIESHCFEFAWSENDFLQCLRHRNCIGMVAEQDGLIVGYMVYELNHSQIRLLNFAVAPDSRRHRVGTQMVERLVARLASQRRTWISLTVRETNLLAQIFFRSCGFVAVSILQDYYEDTTEDAYLMQYCNDAPCDAFAARAAA